MKLTLILVAAVVSVGCVASRGPSAPCLSVALATYVDGSCPASYEVTETLSGSFPAKSVTVMYSKNSLPPGGLATNAILILQSPTRKEPPPDEWYMALGCDAYRGILPDTPGNRRWIKSIRPADLAVNIPARQLPRHEALRIAQEEAHALFELPEDAKCSAVRSKYGYGWFVLFEWGNGEPDSQLTLIIGDDGKRKDREAGR